MVWKTKANYKFSSFHECCAGCGGRVRVATYHSSLVQPPGSPSLGDLPSSRTTQLYWISDWNWRDILCLETCRSIRDSAHMNGFVCCCTPCKPRYRRLVDSIYPCSAIEGINGSNLNKLTFYASSHSEKLERIGEYLVQRLSRDLARLRFSQVKVAVEAMDSLLKCCHSSPSLPQLSESHLKMVQKLLESNIPDMEQVATDSFVKFSNIEESTTSYHRQYDFFISKFSQMCHSNNEDAMKVRIAGLKGLRGVVWKSVTDDLQPNIWERDHMEKIVPSILYNLHSEDDVDLEEPEKLPLFDGAFHDENVQDEETPKTLSDQCLRELMGKATFGSLRAVLEPVLKHLDHHKKWQPPPKFAIQVFRAILYSIQTQNSYFVIQELINHLDTMSSSDASVRIGIATVLSSIVSIAGTSIGPLLLSIFNSLLKHLRASVEFQQSKRCPSQEDEKTYQETLINAMGDFANALPDYQKVEMMMFTVGNIPNLSDERRARDGDAFLQHVLVKTLLKVATKYRTAYLATVFTDSFLNTLVQLALVGDQQVRLVTQKIFHTLLDRHDNGGALSHLGYEVDVSDMQLTVEKCSRADQMFMRKHVTEMMHMLYRASALLPDDENLQEHADAVQCTMTLLCVEVGYDETLLELFRLSLALQSLALDSGQPYSNEKRAAIHNLVAKYLNLSSQLLAIPALCQHVQQVVATRANRGPVLLNVLSEEAKECLKEGDINGERIDMESLDDEQTLLFQKNDIAESLKASGKDVSRLAIPFMTVKERDSDIEDTTMIDGIDRVVDDASVDLSFDWSPPDSLHQSRRNTVFSISLPISKTSTLNSTVLPLTVTSLRDYVNSPFDAMEEEVKETAVTRQIVENMRTKPFDELADEATRQNEETDLSRCIARLLARNADTVKMKNAGRKSKPKSIFDINMPKFVY